MIAPAVKDRNTNNDIISHTRLASAGTSAGAEASEEDGVKRSTEEAGKSKD